MTGLALGQHWDPFGQHEPRVNQILRTTDVSDTEVLPMNLDFAIQLVADDCGRLTHGLPPFALPACPATRRTLVAKFRGHREGVSRGRLPSARGRHLPSRPTDARSRLAQPRKECR